MDLLSSRGIDIYSLQSWHPLTLGSAVRTVMKKVVAVALVVGREDIPAIPKHEDELRLWYITVCSTASLPLLFLVTHT